MFLVIKKRSLSLILILILTVIVAFCLIGNKTSQTFAEHREVPIYRVDREDNKIAITFDAAWGADKTRKIVDILTENDIKATFFLVGFWIDKYQEETKYIHNKGMEIGNHSMNHLKMSTIDQTTIEQEINGVNDKVKNLTGEEPKVFRPPFGDYNNTLIKCINEANMKPIQWDVDSLDWKGLSSGIIAKRIFDRVKSGSIILCHNNSDHIVEAMPMIILTLKNRGYEFVTVSELIHQDNYIIDNNGVQHLKNMEDK